MRDSRQRRDVHALDDDGMLLCNPRDREAVHRAEVDDIATGEGRQVTCRKCVELLGRRRPALRVPGTGEGRFKMLPGFDDPLPPDVLASFEEEP